MSLLGACSCRVWRVKRWLDGKAGGLGWKWEIESQGEELRAGKKRLEGTRSYEGVKSRKKKDKIRGGWRGVIGCNVFSASTKVAGGSSELWAPATRGASMGVAALKVSAFG